MFAPQPAPAPGTGPYGSGQRPGPKYPLSGQSGPMTGQNPLGQGGVNRDDMMRLLASLLSGGGGFGGIGGQLGNGLFGGGGTSGVPGGGGTGPGTGPGGGGGGGGGGGIVPGGVFFLDSKGQPYSSLGHGQITPGGVGGGNVFPGLQP